MSIVIVLNKTVSAIYHWFLGEAVNVFCMSVELCHIFIEFLTRCLRLLCLPINWKSFEKNGASISFSIVLSFVVLCFKLHLIPTNIYNGIKVKRYVFNVQGNHLSWSDVWFMSPLIILHHSIYFFTPPVNAITIPEESGKEWQQQDIYWNTSSLLTFLLCDKSAELSGWFIPLTCGASVNSSR